MDERMTMALWRYQVIAPLLALDGTRGSLKRELTRITERPHEHPHRGTVRVGYGTAEQWLYNYRRHGLDGLRDRPRRDAGNSRIIDDELAEAIETLARAYPDLDGPGILAELSGQRSFRIDQLPSLSSLYRFLKVRGLDQRRAPVRKDHRAFTFDLAGDCWQSDVMYGPALATREGSRRKTYLIAVLDDATRLIPHAQFYFEQHLRSLKDCLRQAFMKRGLPRRLYVDNGRIFRSRMILQIGARLGIQLIHTRPYQPQGRSKLERWFGTVRRAFLVRLDLARVEDLDALNRLFWAWVEGVYHVKSHRGIEGSTPLDRWLARSEGLRPLPADIDLDRLFLENTTRRVAKDGTLTLKGKTFEAGPLFIGERVKVVFDPFDLRKVIVCAGGGRESEAFPVDLVANRHVRRNPTPDPPAPKTPPPPLTALDDLADRMEEENEPTEEKDHGE